MATQKQQDNTAATIVKVVGLGILAVVLGFIIFGDRSNCGIDKATLACRWSGSIADILGVVIFLGSCLWAFGLFKKASINESPGSTSGNYMAFIGAIVGMILIWIA